MYARINKIILLLMLLCLTAACSSKDDEQVVDEEYIPFRAPSATNNTVYLSLKQDDGTAYNYENLVATKGIKAYGELSKQELPIEYVKKNGKEYLKFDADLPNKSKMQIKRGKDYDYADGTSRAFVYLNNKKITLTFYFIFRSKDTILGTYGNNYIKIDKIELNNRTISYGEENLAYCTIKKNAKGNFELEQ